MQEADSIEPWRSLLAEMGILNLNACIAVALKEDEYLTNASVDFHKHLVISVWESSTDAAISLTVGIIWYGMEKMIGEHKSLQTGSKAFSGNPG